jgi:hypothetical protein
MKSTYAVRAARSGCLLPASTLRWQVSSWAPLWYVEADLNRADLSILHVPHVCELLQRLSACTRGTPARRGHHSEAPDPNSLSLEQASRPMM